MYYFIKTKDKDNPHDVVDRVEFKINTEDIDYETLLEEFKNFLRACGFVFTESESD